MCRLELSCSALLVALDALKELPLPLLAVRSHAQLALAAKPCLNFAECADQSRFHSALLVALDAFEPPRHLLVVRSRAQLALAAKLH